MNERRDFGSMQDPDAMKAYFDRQRKDQESREQPKPAEGRGPAAAKEAAPAGTNMVGFRNTLETLVSSVELSKRSTRESPDELASVEIKRFLAERNSKNDWAKVEYPAGMFRLLRQLKTQLADTGVRERLPHGDALKAAVETALDQFE